MHHAATCIRWLFLLPVAAFAGVVDSPRPMDFDGDGRADPAVYEKYTGLWHIRSSSSGLLLGGTPQAWGSPDAEPVPGDYDGDGRTDLAVFVAANTTWHIRKSSDGQLFSGAPVSWGVGNVAVPADYDADGRTDIATFDSSNGIWFIRKSSDGTMMGGGPILWGSSAKIPVAPVDWDGDGFADLTVYDMPGRYYSYYSTRDQKPELWLTEQYQNFPGYFVPLAADYDGDGEAESAIYQSKAKLLVGDYGLMGVKRPGVWSLIPPGNSTLRWGGRGAYPVAADFNGDGKADLAYYDPRAATWAVYGVGSYTLGNRHCVPADNQVRIMRTYGILP